ncbi:MAG: alpha-E domain-containing protein [Synechococcales bacterium]|nr:alpha-E domain-containing protein [Synechococcales bacterium]
MLSRVADAIYWMNRYIERAENIARFMDVNLNLLLDAPSGTHQQWEPLILTTGDRNLFQERYGEATQENVIRFLTFDKAYPNSILSCLMAARENARSIREIISSEMWQQINAFYHLVQDTANAADQVDWFSFFEQVKSASHLYVGITTATMTHNEGWHFGQLGRLLERADKTTRILDVKYFILLPCLRDVGSSLDELQWVALLRSTSAYEMYRKCGMHRITPNAIAAFLLLDRDFPRSTRFCIQQAEQSLHKITGNPMDNWDTPVERTLGRLRADLDYYTIDELVEDGLHEFLDSLQSRMNQVDTRIFEAFFALESVN